MKIKLRKFKKSDAKAIALLIIKTHKRFNGREFFKKSAVQEYLDYYSLEKNSISGLCKKFQRTPIFYVAVNNKKIIGIIRGRLGYITNLFIDGAYHKKGIGRRLVEKFEADIKKQKAKVIKIRASLYAAPFYQKVGYKKTTGIRNFRGLKIYPMKKIIK